MDQPTFQNLSGIELTSVQIDRFDTVKELAQEQLEGLLGWPLDPADWENQYEETGKDPGNDGSCPDADAELDSPDAVVGSYRLYPWNGTDAYLHIDPATAIHAVKLVRNDVTCKTYEVDEYRMKWENGKVKITRYLQLCNDCLCPCSQWNDQEYCRMLAVDADWAFAADEDGTLTIPLELQRVWAELIADELDDKKDVKSESITSHSYTKYDRKTIEEKYGSVLKKYAGPRGLIKRKRIV